MSPLEKARKARTKLLMSQPFFGYLAAKMGIVESAACETNATDGRNVYINAEHWKKISTRQAIFEMAHEVLHNVARHTRRRNGRDPKMWNDAGDLAINVNLKDSKSKDGLDIFEMPDDCLIDEQYRGMTAEEIYDILRNKKSNQGGSGGAHTKCIVMDAKSPSGGGQDGEGEGKGEHAGGNEGQGDDEKGGGCPVPEESENINWAVAVKEAIAYAKARGSMPAHLEAWIEKLLKPKVDWRAILYRYMSHARRDDYSYRKPNKRYAHLGIVLPSLYNHVGSVVIAEDTSGSISDENLAQFKAEVFTIARCLKLDVTWIQADAAVQAVYKVKDANEIKKFSHKGRGGTDFTPVFKYIENEKLKPDVLVYLTDGDGALADTVRTPRFDVLWVLTKGGSVDRDVMRFGKILEAEL